MPSGKNISVRWIKPLPDNGFIAIEIVPPKKCRQKFPT
jgi:hypothetical protein